MIISTLIMVLDNIMVYNINHGIIYYIYILDNMVDNIYIVWYNINHGHINDLNCILMIISPLIMVIIDRFFNYMVYSL